MADRLAILKKEISKLDEHEQKLDLHKQVCQMLLQFLDSCVCVMTSLQVGQLGSGISCPPRVKGGSLAYSASRPEITNLFSWGYKSQGHEINCCIHLVLRVRKQKCMHSMINLVCFLLLSLHFNSTVQVSKKKWLTCIKLPYFPAHKTLFSPKNVT